MSGEAKEYKDAQWQQIIEDLRVKLAEAEEILRAIAEYRVDAFVMGGDGEKQVYTLIGADHAYQVILETISEGAATISQDGTVLYCNPAFAALLHLSVPQVIGAPLARFVDAAHLSTYTSLIQQGLEAHSKGELLFVTASGTSVPVLFSSNALKLDTVHCVCVVATDLTEQKRQEKIILEHATVLQETNQRLEREIEERKQAEIALTEVRQRLNHIREMERLLLARELHDGPLQEVIAMAFDLLLLAQTLEGAEQVEKLQAMSRAVQKTARQLRLVAQTLRPPVLAHLGLAAALRAHVKQVQETTATPAFACVAADEMWSVPEDVAIALLRVAQQAIQNALQHAQANQVEVRLSYDQERLCLEIEDDGVGFRRPYNRVELAREGHLGVVGMAERVEAIRGELQIVSQPGKGTCIRVTVPKPADENPGSE